MGADARSHRRASGPSSQRSSAEIIVSRASISSASSRPRAEGASGPIHRIRRASISSAIPAEIIVSRASSMTERAGGSGTSQYEWSGVGCVEVSMGRGGSTGSTSGEGWDKSMGLEAAAASRRGPELASRPRDRDRGRAPFGRGRQYIRSQYMVPKDLCQNGPVALYPPLLHHPYRTRAL